MLDNETKRRIDTARDILVGKVPDPKSQVEQITISLIYKFMDDMDAEAEELGGKRKFFSGEFERYSWKKLMAPDLGGFDVLTLYGEAIQKMNINPNIPQLFRDIFKNAFLPYRDPETLKSFLKVIDDFEYDHSERLGDAFEYLLSVLGSQGEAGQFRTPRHIIDFMVDVISPKKDNTILDPACGTAGFLISSYKHILKHNSSNFIPEKDKEAYQQTDVSIAELTTGGTQKYKGDKLTPDERAMLSRNIKGYDISPDMVRLSLVNLYLHGFTDPKISEYDTLTNEDNWNEYADVIMANPPFMSPKGGIKPHKRFSIQSNRSEVLFVDYIVEHLTPNGKAAIIVPEGIIFQSGKAYKQLRKMLVENYLFAVVSLPAGVFQPYSGVKTSILLIDKTLNKKTDKILFVKIENDGFDLGAQRRPKAGSQLPISASLVKEYITTCHSGLDTESTLIEKFGPNNLWNIATKEKIGENEDWNLSGERYQHKVLHKASNYTLILIRDLTEIVTKGTTPTTAGYNFVEEGINFIKIESITDEGKFIPSKFAFITEECHQALKRSQLKQGDVLFSIAGAFGRTAVVIKDILPANTNQALSIIRLKRNLIIPEYLFWILKSEKILEEVQSLKVGVAQYNLSLKQINEIKIPLPPLEIQKEIVAEIEGWQKIIDGARQVVENYKPQIDIDPEWEMVSLAEIIKLSSGKGLAVSQLGEGKHPVYGGNGINGYHTEYFLDNSTIVIGRVGAYCGAVHITQPKSWVTDNGLYVTDFLREINIKYLAQSLTQLNLNKYAKVGGQPSISQKTVTELQIAVPKIKIQEEIVSRLETEEKIVEQNKKLISIFEQKIKYKIAKVWGE
ncbi:MAG: N-6 DNA methylase [Ignavibacterium sp.]|jgi:type I restriction enzyme M protein|nr:N-6 DNA methylase [Ignavibacterium sp.]